MGPLLGVFMGLLIAVIFMSPQTYPKHEAGSGPVSRMAGSEGKALTSIKVFPDGKKSTALTFIDERTKLGADKTGGPFTIVVFQKEGKMYLSVLADDNPKDVFTAILE